MFSRYLLFLIEFEICDYNHYMDLHKLLLLFFYSNFVNFNKFEKVFNCYMFSTNSCVFLLRLSLSLIKYNKQIIQCHWVVDELSFIHTLLLLYFNIGDNWGKTTLQKKIKWATLKIWYKLNFYLKKCNNYIFMLAILL